MSIQASPGAIKHSDIQSEFGGANPISQSEYYRGGALVPNHPNNTNIPTSGAIKISDFYDTSYAYRVTVTISASVTNVSLTSLLNPTTYSVPYIISLVINSGVEITSTSTSTPALDIGTGWNAGTQINIHNYGLIAGKGGNGGHGGTGAQCCGYAFPGGGGTSGGPGLQIPNPASTTVNLYIYSTGRIGGGGGGGGGGGAGAICCAVAYYGAGGGGGGGAGSGSGGTGGTTNGQYGVVQVGSNGSAGTTTAGGSRGNGYGGSYGYGGYGGNGGGLGQNGNEGISGCGNFGAAASGGVGAGGYSIVGYPWISFVSNSGTISGSTTSYPASLPAVIARSDSYNYPGCPWTRESLAYWNGADNPYAPPPPPGDGDDAPPPPPPGDGSDD